MSGKSHITMVPRSGRASDNGSSGDHTGGSGTGNGGDNLEARVVALEKSSLEIRERLIRVETKLEGIEKTMATKADLSDMAASFHKAMTEQTWKFLAGATSMSALFATIAFGLAHFLK